MQNGRGVKENPKGSRSCPKRCRRMQARTLGPEGSLARYRMREGAEYRTMYDNVGCHVPDRIFKRGDVGAMMESW